MRLYQILFIALTASAAQGASATLTNCAAKSDSNQSEPSKVVKAQRALATVFPAVEPKPSAEPPKSNR